MPSEQGNRPLVDYTIGPRFLDSLDKLEEIKDEKVADVGFEIVTGLAPQIPSREVHHLRTGPGGDGPSISGGRSCCHISNRFPSVDTSQSITARAFPGSSWEIHLIGGFWA